MTFFSVLKPFSISSTSIACSSVICLSFSWSCLSASPESAVRAVIYAFRSAIMSSSFFFSLVCSCASSVANLLAYLSCFSSSSIVYFNYLISESLCASSYSSDPFVPAAFIRIYLTSSSSYLIRSLAYCNSPSKFLTLSYASTKLLLTSINYLYNSDVSVPFWLAMSFKR